MKNKTTANWLIVSMVLGVIGASIQDGADLFYTLAGLGLMVFSVIGALKVKKVDETLAYITLSNLAIFWIAFLGKMETGVTLTSLLMWVMAIWLSVKLYKIAD